MKCPNCNQEMLDIKDYCVNCGKRLIKDKNCISLFGLFLVFSFVIVLGIVACYFIMNFNTDKEIEPYLNNKIIENADNE